MSATANARYEALQKKRKWLVDMVIEYSISIETELETLSSKHSAIEKEGEFKDAIYRLQYLRGFLQELM